jgi:hypothetical protein
MEALAGAVGVGLAKFNMRARIGCMKATGTDKSSIGEFAHLKKVVHPSG